MTATRTACTASRTVLGWCGADDALYAPLADALPHGAEIVRTPSEFLEALHGGSRWGRIVLAGKPASETLRLLEKIHNEDDDLPAIVVLSEPSVEDVRLFLRMGATDVVWVDELDPAMFREDLGAGTDVEEGGAEEGAAEAAASEEAVDAVSDLPPQGSSCRPEEIVCLNENMRKVADIARRIAPTDSTVLIQGESGTGKELIACMIHGLSRRRDHPFVTVNCGAIPEPLLESQLYGHERGSFTGAVKQQKGLFEIADHGTILLDEIGEMGLEMQVKLLRFLQSREFRRVGGNEVLKVSVRVIAATNRDLKDAVARGHFRTDLYYRLNVITLAVPPLRERPEEIPVLVDHFIRKLHRERGVAVKRFSAETIMHLRSLPWEGNVRELENAVERLLLLAPGDVITEADMREFLDAPVAGALGPSCAEALQDRTEDAADRSATPALPTLSEVERAHIARALSVCGWNKMRTARALGINVKTLYNKIRAYQLIPPPEAPPRGPE